MEPTKKISPAMETDELTDAVFSLRLLSELLDNVELENLYWKWILIALHNSLQSFMVSALWGARPSAIAADESKRDKKVLEKYETFLSCTDEGARMRRDNEPLVEPRLKRFWPLYEKFREESAVNSFLFDTEFVPTDDQDESIKLLHELRNEFVHFRPGFILADVLQYPRLVLDCLKLAEYIVSESESLIWPELDALEEQAKGLIRKIGEQTELIESKYREAFPDMF
jgi:hypothetical protein